MEFIYQRKSTLCFIVLQFFDWNFSFSLVLFLFGIMSIIFSLKNGTWPQHDYNLIPAILVDFLTKYFMSLHHLSQLKSAQKKVHWWALIVPVVTKNSKGTHIVGKYSEFSISELSNIELLDACSCLLRKLSVWTIRCSKMLLF